MKNWIKLGLLTLLFNSCNIESNQNTDDKLKNRNNKLSEEIYNGNEQIRQYAELILSIDNKLEILKRKENLIRNVSSNDLELRAKQKLLNDIDQIGRHLKSKRILIAQLSDEIC